MKQVLIEKQDNIGLVYIPKYEDKLWKEVLKKSVKEFKDTKAIPHTIGLGYKEGEYKGSNPYFVCILGNNLIAETGKNYILPMTPSQSEQMLKQNPDFLKDFYIDSGLLTIYHNNEVKTNPVTYDSILSQLKSDDWKHQFSDLDLSKPFVIFGLMNIKKDSSYENGLKFEVSEYTKAFNHNVLLEQGLFAFDSNDPGLEEKGLPLNLGKGNRNLYVGDEGVRGFCRNWDLNLDAGNGNLALSDDTGRVRFVENFSKGSSGLVNNLEKQILFELNKKTKALQEIAEEAITKIRNR